MANPNPQHNPTDGLNVAAYVQVTGTGITGIGAGTGSTGHPVAQYALTLSLSAAGGHAATCQLTTVLKDVNNTTYTPVGSPVYKSYNDPDAGTPAWFHPSPFTDGTVTYATSVASVSGSGLITSIAVGQAIIEVQFPTFDSTVGDANNETEDPVDMIYVQIVVTVIP